MKNVFVSVYIFGEKPIPKTRKERKIVQKFSFSHNFNNF